MSAIEEAMRRVITGNDADGKSIMIVDGGPANGEARALYEIWEDALAGVLDPADHADRGPRSAVLSPASGRVKVRWFTVGPTDPSILKEQRDANARAAFASFGAAHHIKDQTRHHLMHETATLDVICVLQGEVSLILDGAETRLKPGNVVIQRGTNHAWEAHGGPALLLAVLIDRPLRTSAGP